jgi:hypothetical protein
MEKRMKNQTSFWAVCLLAAALFLVPQAAQAQCSLATFSGTYVFNDNAIPFFIAPIFAQDSVGVLTADGAGHITFTETAFLLTLPAFGGLLPLPGSKILSESTYTGTYLVNPDCTMAMTMQSSNNNCFVGECYFPIHHQAVLVRGGKALYFIDNDPNVTGSGAGTQI